MESKKLLAGIGGLVGFALLAIVVVVGLYLGGVIKEPSSGGKGGGREAYGSSVGGCQSCPYQQD